VLRTVLGHLSQDLLVSDGAFVSKISLVVPDLSAGCTFSGRLGKPSPFPVCLPFSLEDHGSHFLEPWLRARHRCLYYTSCHNASLFFSEFIPWLLQE